MTASMTLVQARLSLSDAERLDADARALGLATRSEAVRTALKLLHEHAAHVALAREYDEFYGREQAPVTDVSIIGDEIAVEVMREGD